jgi:glycosyltransferase involved in cell wall biosynthesis
MTNSTDVAFVKTEQKLLIPQKMGRLTDLKPLFSNFSYLEATKQRGPVIYHGLSNFNLPQLVPVRPKDRFVLTIHDIIPLLLPKTSALKIQMHVLLAKAVDRADKIIAISEWTKETILEKYGPSMASKIEVIGNAFETRSAHEPYERHNDFLCVSRWEDYKRIEMFVDIARAIPDARFCLVTNEEGKAHLLNTPKNLLIKTNLSRIELEQEYADSKVLVHPSIYEGWCLPASDAITFGVEVIYQSGSGIDEVCKFAGSNAYGLPKGAELSFWVDACSQRIKIDSKKSGDSSNFWPSWKDVARKTLKIYQDLV